MNPPPGDEQDARDMARLAAGHDSALNELMERHAEKLFHYLVRSLQNEEDAADLAQETFVKVYQNRARFDAAQKFSTWLYAIASNLVRDRYRWRLRHPELSLEAETEQTGVNLKENLPSLAISPDLRTEMEEEAATVREAVAALPLELRQPLIMAVYQDMSQAEIAQVLKCSVKAVETRIYRARQQLRAKLAELLSPV